MPRVTLLSAFYTPFVSGAERMVVETVERLAGRFAFTVVTARLDRKLPRRETMRGKDGSAYEVIRLGLGLKIDKWLYAPLAALWTRRHPAEVVHAVMESYAGIASWLSKAWGAKGRVVLTLQSGDLDMPVKAARIPRGLWKRIHVAPDVITAISTALGDRATKLGAKDVRVIPNGVDFSHLAKVPRGAKVPHRVAIVARLSPEKGLPHLLDAMAILRKRVPDAELTLVGGGALEAELKAQAERLGLKDAVRFTGALPNLEAMTHVATAGVFALPSLGEGLGIVLLEAQALDVPVVGTRVGGIPDVIEDGATGLLVPPADSEALASALARIMTEPDLGPRLVTGARGRLARFDWDKIAETFSALYSER